jgi:hypothetical protein
MPVVISAPPFAIVYRARGDAIEITRILHGAKAALARAGIGFAGLETLQILPNLVTDTPESSEPLLFGTLQGGRVFKVAMDGNRFTRKNRAALFGVVADGQDVVQVLAGEFIDALGTVTGNVDAQFLHGGNGFGPDVAWLGSGAEHLEAIPGIVTQQAFGHLAPG